MTEERDPKVSRRYRELAAEEPPRELDQAILAAAHRAADHSHAPLVPPVGRHRWYFAFGAAAILVLAVAVTVQVERQPDPEAMSSSTASVPGDREDRFYSQAEKENKAQAEPSKPLADAGPPPAREQRKTPAQPAARAATPPAEVQPQAAEVARADRLRMQNAPAAAPATPAPSQPGSQDLSPGAAAGMFSIQEQARKSRETASATAPSADAPRPQAAEAARADRLEAKPGPAPGGVSSSVLGAGVALSPERMLEGIAELRKEGRHEEADKALAEFRKLYPDYRISEEMLRKVERSR